MRLKHLSARPKTILHVEHSTEEPPRMASSTAMIAHARPKNWWGYWQPRHTRPDTLPLIRFVIGLKILAVVETSGSPASRLQLDLPPYHSLP
jgi:hypothetical protein